MIYPLVLVMVVVSAPLLGALGAWKSGRAMFDRWFSALAVIAGVALVVRVHRNGAAALLGGTFGVDRVGAAWALFVVVIGLAVRTFARRQLAAEPARERFHVLSAAAVAAAALLCLSGDLWAVVAASAGTSLAASALVGVRGDRPTVVRRMRATLLAGDALLLVAVVLTAVHTGSVEASALGELDGAWRHAVAVAVVLAAIVKCAQPPVHGWLPRTLVAPTPVSALLHAGIVNAGGVLLVRFAPVVARSLLATIVGLVLAGAGALAGAAVMRARADVKGELVWSTVAQMGFMLVQVLLGLGPAAAAHLIAHGAYKSSLFLGSGSGIEHRPVPASPVRAVHFVIAVLLAAGIVGGAMALTGFAVDKHGGAQVLVPVFAGLTVLTVLAGPAGVRRGATPRVAGLVAGVAAGTVAYLWGIARFEDWLQLPDHTPDGSLVLALVFVGAVLAAAAAVALVERGTVPALARSLQARSVAVSRRPVLDTVIAGGM
jgi:NAD(P)H-quinone oxidoreductase subunit 5